MWTKLPMAAVVVRRREDRVGNEQVSTAEFGYSMKAECGAYYDLLSIVSKLCLSTKFLGTLSRL